MKIKVAGKLYKGKTMDRRDLSEYLTFNPMFVGLVAAPRRPKPMPPNEYRRGFWAQVFYTKRDNPYMVNYPVKRTWLKDQWFDVDFERALIVTRINYFEGSKYLGYTINRLDYKISGLGIRVRHLKS